MEGEVAATLETLVRGVLDNLRDPRVGNALKRDFLPRVVEETGRGFGAHFRELLGESAGEADEMPATSGDEAVAWIVREHPLWLERAAEAVARGIGTFVRENRDEVLASMRKAGEAPPADRNARLDEVRGLLDKARALGTALEGLPERADPDAVHGAIQPAVEELEKARDLLAEAELDDAILGVAAAPDGTPRSMAEDVEDLMRRSWIEEVDLLCRACERVGPALADAEHCSFEQEAFLLDAIVALQEAITLRLDPPDVLRLAHLRLLKGDVGEARAICQKVLEMDPAEPLRVEAEGLLERVGRQSPLGRDRRCFIATAASGPDAPEVETLRGFRDAVLMPRPAGRLLVRTYYRLSPPLARVIATRPWLRAAVRHGLVRPVAGLVEWL